jgi:fructose-1,6-bisphosphatase/inositol monophosphatase family enzyme
LVIVEEAGGRCTSLRGERSIYAGSLLTTNGLLHDEVSRLLQA